MKILEKLFGGAAKETISAAGNVVDRLSVTDTEREKAKKELTEVIITGYSDVYSYQRDIIVAETNSESWLTRNWRPITMLTFVIVIFLRYTGITQFSIPLELESKLMDLIQIGLGGYVASRGIEKVADKVTKGIDLSFLKKRDRADFLKERLNE